MADNKASLLRSFKLEFYRLSPGEPVKDIVAPARVFDGANQQMDGATAWQPDIDKGGACAIVLHARPACLDRRLRLGDDSPFEASARQRPDIVAPGGNRHMRACTAHR